MRGHRLTTEERDQLVEMRRAGSTYEEIHEALGVPRGTIAYHCRKAGLIEVPTYGDDLPQPPKAPVALPWMEHALCAETNPEAFFPEKGASTADAKKVCARCLVQAECLDLALTNGERFGIWGGLSERERRKFETRTCSQCETPLPADAPKATRTCDSCAERWRAGHANRTTQPLTEQEIA